MSSIKFFAKRLYDLEKKTGIQLNVRSNSNHISINGVPFSQGSKEDIYEPEFKNKGILVKALSTEEIRYCEAVRISYFTLSDVLQIFTARYSIKIEPQKKSAKKKSPLVRQTITNSPPSTLLISPNGFKILDALFKLPDAQLSSYRSALAFSKKFNVNQPKLSKMMRTFGVDSLYDLRKAISHLPNDWWTMALNDKATKKGLTPFFVESKPHYSLLNISPDELNADLRKIEASNLQIIPGPLELGKRLGFLRDDDLSYWGTEASLRQLKSRFKLIPGVNKEKPVWQLAVPKFGIYQEAVTSEQILSPTEKEFRDLPRMNLFRAIWDLGFGTERLKELQTLILRRVTNEL